MNPQPPVTKMRTAARTSSARQAALAVSPEALPLLDRWKTWAAEVDWTPWMIVGLGAFLRVILLAIKPPHFDEGINGWFVDQMTKNGFYRYDPTNYHGPLHFYILFLSQTLFGRNLWALRMPVVIASILCVWLALRFQPFVGRNVSRLAALAMAVSPAFIFYGRYSIHEVWLVLFSMLFILGLLGLWRFGTSGYLWATVMGVAGMILTKETYIIHLGCAAIALPVAWISHKITPAQNARPAPRKWGDWDLTISVAAAIAVLIFFYSGTFMNWKGVSGLWETFDAWFKTGQGGKSGHEKEWHYWLMLIGRYETPIAIGLLGSVLCQFFRDICLRYLAIYGVGTLMAYSIVAYKTPWCVISIVWPLLFVFGAIFALAPLKLRISHYQIATVAIALVVIAAIWYAKKQHIDAIWPYLFSLGLPALLFIIANRTATIALLAISLCVSLGLAIRLNYFRCTTDTEPYVYVQTYNDIWKLTDPLLKLARRNPTAYQLVGHMIRPSAYPLPWVLGEFPKIGYYEHDNLPNPLDADFLVVQEAKIATVEAKLQNAYYTMPMTIRPYQDPSKLYLNARVFKDFFPGKAPDFAGKSGR